MVKNDFTEIVVFLTLRNNSRMIIKCFPRLMSRYLGSSCNDLLIIAVCFMAGENDGSIRSFSMFRDDYFLIGGNGNF